MTFRLTIDTDNEAFWDRNTETARILRSVAGT